jgi:hypothetical protein
VVKHAGLCPRENASGAHHGKTSISGKGRPGLRLAAWRAVWAALPNNPVLAARFTYLTTRDHNRLARQQARTACAAALLRWLHVVVIQRVSWDPAIAAGTTPHRAAVQPSTVDHNATPQAWAGRARPTLEEPTSRVSMGSPARPLHQLDCTLSGPNPVVS